MISNKKRFILLFVILATFSLVYLGISSYKKDRVDDILHEHARYLEISYKQGLDRFNIIAKNIYIAIQNDHDLIDILENTNENNLDKNHKKLYKHLENEFEKLKQSGIMGLHILTPQNISIVRMNKQEKYGDDLTQIRPLAKAVNEEKTYMHGFEEGKTSHAFRELYPLYKDGKHIATLEVQFSSTKIQDYTMRASEIHTHFIVNKNVFKLNAWKSNIQEPYGQSIEHKDYLFSNNGHMKHNQLEISSKTIIEPLRSAIDKKIALGKSFNTYQVVDSTAKIVSFLAIQRYVDNKTVAYLVSYTGSKKLYNFLNFIMYLKIILLIVAIFIYLAVVYIWKYNKKMRDELKYDDLTQIYNRKHFIKMTSELWQKSEETKREFCIVIADIDYFKNVNDTHGHQYGDTVLIEFASILKNSVRSNDIVARYGGEEFILYIETEEENALRVIENLRIKVEEYAFGEKGIHLTASFGIAKYIENSTMHTLTHRADVALYQAKASGRNQVQAE